MLDIRIDTYVPNIDGANKDILMEFSIFVSDPPQRAKPALLGRN